MTNRQLDPQIFPTDAVTLLPEIDFYQVAFDSLPQVYKNAPNFISFLQQICIQKQYIYDVIRSLVNVYNLNSSDGFAPATPSGIYLEMLASNLTAPVSENENAQALLSAINNRIGFINSRGRPKDFYTYFRINGYGNYWNNTSIIEQWNATISITLPLPPMGSPDPLDAFKFDMFRLKGAGIEINTESTEAALLTFSKITGGTPVYNPAGLGWGIQEPRGNVVGGGYFKRL